MDSSPRVAPALATLVALALAGDARAATLPPHAPLRILVVGDAVNPNNLPPDQLTEPPDLRAALASPQGGLNLDGGDAAVTLVDSQCIDDALTLLAGGTLDVVVYFAHMAARRCDKSDAQPALTAAFSEHLVAGGGIVVFHHGIYENPGKQAVLDLLGGVASSIQWQTQVGQRVISVAPDHFVVSNNVAYTDEVAYADPGNNIPAGMYDAFTNLPDERYPALALLPAPGETRTILLASDYDGNGTNKHVLGYDLQRPGWTGRVVFLQPGEFQPLILDTSGAPFQVLANAVVHAAGALAAGETTGGETTGDATTADTTTGDPDPPVTTTSEPTGDAPSTGDSADTGTPTTAPGPETTTDAPTTSTTGNTVTGDPGPGTAADEQPDESGCACRSAPHRADLGLLALAALGLRRRRRR